MRIKCIIIEDEPLAAERAKNFVEKLPFLDLLATFDNAIEALTFIRENQVDLLFLDIHLDELSGIQLLETSTIDAQVILTTAYHQYALKGFDLNVTDYLLKPYSFERFIQAVDKVRSHLLKTEIAQHQDFIFVKTENRLEKIDLNEILYIEGMRDYRKIYTDDKRIMTLQTFSELEQIIAPQVVCRVHKSYMVALSKIEAVEKNRIKIRDQIIPISETYKKQFYSLINH